MTKKTYTKSSLSIDEQIGLLAQRGLIIKDKDKTRHCLRTVSYYRLSAYFKPFEQEPISGQHTFKPNTHFEQIWDLYIFDRELRLLALDAIERIEIALRTSLAFHLSHQYDPWWYLNQNIFGSRWITVLPGRSNSLADAFKATVNDICYKKEKEFIRHYYRKYDKPEYPPSWMIIECLSFGKIASLYRNLKSNQDKSTIAKVFGLHHHIFESLLESLRYTRNLCAHHSRYWNRWTVYKPRRIKELIAANCVPGTTKEQLCIISLLHQAICPESTWHKRLYQLFQKYPAIPYTEMGFQAGWSADPFWRAINAKRT